MREESKIVEFFHCKTCTNGLLSVGYTSEQTLQVYCDVCGKPVVEFGRRGDAKEADAADVRAPEPPTGG